MGLVWNLSAFITTIAILLIFGAIWNKAKNKKDSPLNKLIDKFRFRKKEDSSFDDEKHYKRLSHKSGLKW